MGTLYTWGRGSDGQLGHDFRCPVRSENCALPHPVKELLTRKVVHVACGGGQQGCTGAVTDSGKLFVFGNNYGGRLGFLGEHVGTPREVPGVPLLRSVAFGSRHGIAVSHDGDAWSWGTGLGVGRAGSMFCAPAALQIKGKVTSVDAEHKWSAVVLDAGELLTFGSNEYGKLGVGKSSTELTHRVCPTQISGGSSMERRSAE